MCCGHLEDCGFYKNFGHRQSKVWQGLVGYYCHGNGWLMCECRTRFRKTGKSPAGQMLPTGMEIPKAFLALP